MLDGGSDPRGPSALMPPDKGALVKITMAKITRAMRNLSHLCMDPDAPHARFSAVGARLKVGRSPDPVRVLSQVPPEDKYCAKTST